ncbi:MAG: hypothetical protein WC227_01905 [Patescibacteria group bacterium]|jgi:hypothetical protein
MNFLYFLMCAAVGFALLRYFKWFTDSTGRIGWIEEHAGAGMTYTFWQVMGVASIAFGFYLLFQ